MAHEEKNMAGQPIAKSGWHGRRGVYPLPAGTHIRPAGSERSAWNVKKTKEEAAATVKIATNAAAGGAPQAVKAAKVAVKASKEATEAAKAAAKFERELDAALLKQDREMRRAEAAAARATAAATRATLGRRTKKKSSSSGMRPTSSSSVRRTSSHKAIYRPASALSSRAASGSPARMPRNMGTPISPERQEPNRNKLQAIGESLIGLPELA